jgi:DNA repair protein RecO (recombination protein O)
MSLVETEGLVLKSYSLAEADKIVVLLTKNQGVVRGVARGAKRLKSRFGGALEIFSIVEVSYYQKDDRELVSIGNIEIIKSYFEIASEPDFLESFVYLIELLVEFAQPHDPNERLYRMTKVCLDTAAEHPGNFESIIVYFELWLLKLGGYLPEWSRCYNCRREFNDEESAGLQINFHLICNNCQKGAKNFYVSKEQRKIFLAAQQASPARFLKFTKNQDEDVREISAILKRLISNILGKEIASGRKTITRI